MYNQYNFLHIRYLRSSIILFLMVMCLVSFGQGESNIWYFGSRIGIDFNTPTPSLLKNGIMNQGEGLATVCDKNGNLLFYTDGLTIFNSRHDTMPNGKNLGGGSSSSQSAIIVPKPGKENDIYYVFTVPTPGPAVTSLNSGTNSLSYSIVDMNPNLGFGYGDVIEKNVILYDTTTEKLTAMRHSNGRDVWIISHQWLSDAFYAFLLTPEGLCHNPVISHIGSFHGQITYQGCIAGSHDNRKLVNTLHKVPLGQHNIELFDFDNSTGVLSNTIEFLNYHPIGVFGAEFSPDNTKLYISHNLGGGEGGIYQFDLSSGNSTEIITSGYAIPMDLNNDNIWALEIAPDGKIYICTQETNSYISTIDFPNERGVACNYVSHALYLEGHRGYLGLPQKVLPRKNLEIKANDQSVSQETFCLLDSIYMTSPVLSGINVELKWYIEENIISVYDNQSTLVYVFEQEGTFDVTLYITDLSNSCPLIDSVSKKITIQKCDVFIPNAFSPNNDGYNDIFKVASRGYSDIDFQIFDKLGKVVYVNNNDIEWDGFSKNRLENGQVLIYSFKAVNSFTKRNIFQTGTITLIY